MNKQFFIDHCKECGGLYLVLEIGIIIATIFTLIIEPHTPSWDATTLLSFFGVCGILCLIPISVCLYYWFKDKYYKQ